MNTELAIAVIDGEKVNYFGYRKEAQVVGVNNQNS